MILGYKNGELLGKKIWDVVSPPDARETLKNYLGVLVNDKPSPEPYFVENKRKDGTLINLQIDWDYEHNDVGVVTGFISVITDISGHKQAENTLKERENLLKNIFDVIQKREFFLTNILDAIPDGISVIDRDFNVIQDNKTMRAWYAHMLPFESKKKCYEVYHSRSLPCEVCPAIKTLKSKKLEREEVPFVNAESVAGTHELFTYPMIDESGEITGVVEHVRDITDQKNN